MADHFWQALKARNALKITWDPGANVRLDNAAIRALLKKTAAAGDGLSARADGNAAAALKSAKQTLSAAYYLPLLAHATMEPMNCTADVKAGGCDLYVGTQVQQVSQTTAAAAAGLTPEQVRVFTTLIGGGFGRRLDVDFIPAAVEASKAVGAPGQVDLDPRRRHDPRHLPSAGLRRSQRRARRGRKTGRLEAAHHQSLDHRAHVSAGQRSRTIP